MSDSYASAPKSLRSLRDRLMHVSRRDGLAFGRLVHFRREQGGKVIEVNML